MRSTLLTACPALALCGAVAFAPATAFADSGSGDSPSSSSSAAPDHEVGAAEVTVSPSTAHTGDTVTVTGKSAPYPGAKYESVDTKAGVVHITDTDAEHVRGTMRVNAGPGTYKITMKFSNGTASVTLHVVKAPKPTPPAPNPAPTHPSGGGGSTGHTTPKGAPRTGLPADHSVNADMTLAGAGLVTVAAGGLVGARLGRRQGARDGK
ncbi:hypothetical protein [Streptomyces sp. cg36]|uniref:hypothetical protein n=1 Tax=Streptomyces sp. cg36 TaxID=3238798 RepID=UPI0034E28390